MIRRDTKRRSQSTRRFASFLRLESLEDRRLMSADLASVLSPPSEAWVQVETGLIARAVAAPTTTTLATSAVTSATPSAAAIGPAVTGPYTPTQIRHAYGVDQLSYDGTGQTIAIVDAYDNPTIATDLASFSNTFGLPAANFTKVYTSGSSATSTAPSVNSGWALEIALDVEWAHAIAPGAKILLVEAASASINDLFGAVDYAVAQGASQVSMSFGGGEYGGESSLDTHFNQSGVSFFASAGDSGAEVEFPAVSPYVVGVGGTSISLDAAGNKLSETTWSGSGGGTSSVVARPSYQTGFQTNTNRGVPDVAYDADPNSGIYVLENGSYYEVGGTSAGAPQWGGIAALVNQGRVAKGLATIGTGLTYGLNSALYTLAGGSSYTNPNGDFTDITSGSNGNAATVGYDTATGLGSPVVNKLVPDLVNFGATTTPVAPLVGDASFEAVPVGTGGSAYAYNPTGSAWTFSGNAGIAGNSSAFTAGNPGAPDGTQVAFLQATGSITQSLANVAAGTYQINFTAAQRQNVASNQTLQVLVDGNVVGTINPTGTAYSVYVSPTFTIAAGNHTIGLKGTSSANDYTAFVDLVGIAQVPKPGTPTIGDPSFETVAEGSGPSAYTYDPTGSAWTFSGGAGLSGNNSAFTAGNPIAPQGTQVAFLQNTGSISQSISNWTAGSYTLSILAAQRQNVASNQTLQVLVDGTVVGTINPSATTYGVYYTPTFTVAAGSHTITIQGTGSTTADNTAFIDSIRLNTSTASSTAPTAGDASFETVATGTGSSAYVYDPTGSAWTFSGAAGLSGNNSAFTSANPAAPQGNQVAFLQNTGSITQTIGNWAAGSYTLSFLAAQRQNVASNQTLQVLVDGNVVGTINPTGTTYAAYSTSSFTVATGSHTITIQGTSSSNDYTAFIDNVVIAQATSTKPYTGSI